MTRPMADGINAATTGLATRVVLSELCVTRKLDMNDVVRIFRDDFGIPSEVE